MKAAAGPQDFAIILPFSRTVFDDDWALESVRRLAIETWHERASRAGTVVGEPVATMLKPVEIAIDGEVIELKGYDEVTGEEYEHPWSWRVTGKVQEKR